MADFVAVIRRAVDGLTDNNPEMRVKVYEKARGAVRRQLEAMNPRPPEEMLQRQLDKLEAAIDEVEAEHAEALPDAAEAPLDEPAAGETAPAEAAPEPVVQEPVPDESVTAADEPAQAADETPVYQEPAEPVEAAEDERAQSWAVETPADQSGASGIVEDETVTYQPAETVEHEAYHPAAVEADGPVETPVQEEPASETATQLPVWEAAAEPDHRVLHDERVEEPAWNERQAPAWEEPEQVAPVSHDAARHEEHAAEPFPSWHEAEPAPETAEHDFTQAAEGDLGAVHRPEDDIFHGTGDFGAAPPVERADADPRMPSTDDPWHWPEDPQAEQAGQVAAAPSAVADADPVWVWPEDKAAAAAPAAEAGKSEPNAWNDLEELIGYDRKADQPAEPDPPAGAAPAQEAAPVRDFRIERRSRVNYGLIAALAGVLLVAGGAGAGYWFNRDAVHAWFAEMTSGAATPAPSEGTETAAETTEESSAEQPSVSPESDAQTANETEVAAVEPANGKFTQRLLADGSEVDEGPAPLPEGVVTEEGKSVAEQTQEVAELALGGAEAEGETAATTGEAATATTNEGTQPTVSEDGTAIGVAQKMFLYEERLGQTGPTAIEGSVTWSTAEESPGGDAKPEPVIRGQINVPSRDLTALITIRRNTDVSLPASHIIEIVFSLPDNFEGGSIESVQRVAMKQTEQDRGDPLIAVPAKITEDFHMIALNDFAEAIAKNTELLRERSWIDIPITYRNGRRALITLDKGASGAEAFDTAMKTWATLRATSANSQ